MDLLGSDFDACTFGKALGNVASNLVAYLGQCRGHSRRGLAGKGSPRAKDHALGGIARGNTHALARLIFFWRRSVLGSNLAGIYVTAGYGLFHHGNDVRQGGVAQRLHLQRRNLEVIFHAILNAHTHQGIQAQVNERQLSRQVGYVIAHGLRNDEREAVLHGFLRGIPAHGIDFFRRCRRAFGHLSHAWNRRRTQIQSGGKAFRHQLCLCTTNSVDSHGHTADGLIYHRGDLAVRWQIGVFLGGDDACSWLDGLGRSLDDGQGGWRLVRIGGESNLALGQVNACARQARNASRWTGIGPEALAVELGIGSLYACARAKDRTEVHRHAGDIELAEQVEERLGGIYLAL